MRKYLSVLTIAARSTALKAAALLLLMAASQAALFYRLLQHAPAGTLYTLDQMIHLSRMPQICAAAFVVLCACLCAAERESPGSKSRYTLRRLAVSERTTVLLWSLYNMACLTIFWAAQLLVALLLCRLYLSRMDPAYWNEQTVFLAFYQSPFLHSLLPLAEFSRWFRNITLVLGLGAAAACAGFRQRRNQRGIAVVVLGAMTLIFFSREMGNFFSDFSVALIFLCCAACQLYTVKWGVFDEE